MGHSSANLVVAQGSSLHSTMIEHKPMQNDTTLSKVSSARHSFPHDSFPHDLMKLNWIAILIDCTAVSVTIRCYLYRSTCAVNEISKWNEIFTGCFNSTNIFVHIETSVFQGDITGTSSKFYSLHTLPASLHLHWHYSVHSATGKVRYQLWVSVMFQYTLQRNKYRIRRGHWWLLNMLPQERA